MKLTKKQFKIWENAKSCNCGVEKQDRTGEHKLCAICYHTMDYGAHQSVKTQRNSFHSWNIDHIISKKHGRNNNIKNLQAVHTYCNKNISIHK